MEDDPQTRLSRLNPREQQAVFDAAREQFPKTHARSKATSAIGRSRAIEVLRDQIVANKDWLDKILSERVKPEKRSWKIFGFDEWANKNKRESGAVRQTIIDDFVTESGRNPEPQEIKDLLDARVNAPDFHAFVDRIKSEYANDAEWALRVTKPGEDAPGEGQGKTKF
ncbi:MAG: hypothetical protein ACKVOE_06880 [Rickettsiales bacterium]